MSDARAESGEADRRLLRVGGGCGVLLALLYVVITGVYVVVGAPAQSAAGLLEQLAAHAVAWWWICGLSVFTDLLFLPLGWALVRALPERRALAAVGAGLIALFVALDLALTWPAYARLLSLASDFAAAPDEPARRALEAAAGPAFSLLHSPLFGGYAIALPGVGIAAVAWAARGARFGRASLVAGLLTGALALVAVVGPVWSPGLGAAAIPASIATLSWAGAVGAKLWRLGAGRG